MPPLPIATPAPTCHIALVCSDRFNRQSGFCNEQVELATTDRPKSRFNHESGLNHRRGGYKPGRVRFKRDSELRGTRANGAPAGRQGLLVREVLIKAVDQASERHAESAVYDFRLRRRVVG